MPTQQPVTTQQTGQRAADEAEIRQRIENYAASIRAMDLERVMSMFAPELVSFDIVPPLRIKGVDAKRKNWIDVFSRYERPLGYEITDFTVAVGDDVAFGHSLNRISGTMKNGNKNDMWLRWTTGFRKIDGKWLIVHDQVSVPMNPESGMALRDLQP